MKKDITYEQRVFTNRIVDVDSMSVGNLTSKNIKELKQKDKIDGRFFHTSDTDEWFFCWNGELQKLNLKGATLKDVKELIGKTEVLIENANKTANDAKNIAKSAVESVGDKVDKSVVDALSTKVDAIKLDEYATTSQVDERVSALIGGAPETLNTLDELAAALKDNSDIVDVLTNSIGTKQDKIDDLETIRSGAAAGATALQEVPEEYVTETELIEKGYATTAQVDAKQNVIEDLQTIREGAAAGATALDEAKYYVDGKVDDKFDVAGSAEIAEQNAKDYADSLASNYDASGSAATAEQNAKDYVDGKVDGKFDVSGSAAQALADAKAYADEFDADIDERVKVLEEIDHEKLATDASAAAVATILDSAPEKFDTLKEVAEWISATDSASAAADLVTRVGALEAINHDAYVDADIQVLADAKAYADGLVMVDGVSNFDAAGSAAQALVDAKAYVDGMGYATIAQVDAKQDVITDLETIRSGAAAGATALRSVPSEYVTETELEGKGYATIAQVDAKADELSGKINSIVEITEFEIKDLFAVWKELNIEIKNEDFKEDFEFSDENGISVNFSGGDVSEIEDNATEIKENTYKIKSASTVKITNSNKENVILTSIMFSACVNNSSPNHGVCVYAVSGDNKVELSGTNGKGLELLSKGNFKDIEIPINLNKDEYDYIEISRPSSDAKETLIKNLVICANQKVN